MTATGCDRTRSGRDATGDLESVADHLPDAGSAHSAEPLATVDSPISDVAARQTRNLRTPSRLPQRVRRFALLIVVIALGAEAYAFRHRIASAFSDIKHVGLWWALAAVAASLVSMHCFARTQRRMLHAGGADVPIVRMVGLAYAANAINWTFPGGTALSAGYVLNRLRSWGASRPAATFALAGSGLLSSITFLGLIAVCTVLGSVLGSDRVVSGMAGTGAAVLLVALVALGWRKSATFTRALTAGIRQANRLRRRDRDSGIGTVRQFMTELTSIRPHRRDWVIAGGFASSNWVADLLCLYASCRAVNLDHANLAVIVGSYIAGMTASSVSVVPGGFGVIDVAMVLALTAGGVSSAGAAAGVLMYRLISCALLVAVGWAVWTGTRMTQRHSLDSAALR